MTADDDILDLTPQLAVRPRPADWLRANRLFGHPRGCRCSTCCLAADLGRVVRDQFYEKQLNTVSAS
jgi:hypothetical protein